MNVAVSFTDFEEIRSSANTLPLFDQAAANAARTRQSTLTKPSGSLGRLEDLAVFMAGWRGTVQPRIDTAQALVFAGNHGVCAQGVNPFPQSVTKLMVENFAKGGAAINQLARVADARLDVVPLDLDSPTEDFTTAPAMSGDICLAAMSTGARAVDATADILILGEMGIGNSTVSAALAHAVFGGEAGDWVGRGTGSDDEGLRLKRDVVAAGVARHSGLPPLETLAAFGGREQAAICGAVLAARSARIPVLLDGYICTAATAPLFALNPDLLEHCLVAHTSAEPGHRLLCRAMGKSPILDLGMALGEGTGAALALSILRGALACHNGMATFEEAGITAG